MSVARETGQPFRAVAEESYAVTLYQFMQLQDMQRIERVQELGKRLDVAALSAVAFHEPAKLKDAEREYRDQAGLNLTRDEALATAARTEDAFRRSAQFLAMTAKRDGRAQRSAA